MKTTTARSAQPVDAPTVVTFRQAASGVDRRGAAPLDRYVERAKVH